MLPLPWWILGSHPDETCDEPECEDDEASEESCIEEPLSLYRTPSASPLSESVDHLPKVVDVSTFMNVAKRRSSSRMEDWVSPKLRKTGERKSLVRSETEIMNKTSDGNALEETDGTSERPGSPMPSNGDLFNETFFFDDNNNQIARNDQSESSEESPRARDFPDFFTSFDDTTVIFNTTIAGDIDLNQRNEAVGDWVFKNNKFLNPVSPKTEISGSGDNLFKEPKRRGRAQRTAGTSSAKPSSSRRVAPITVKEEKTLEKEKEKEWSKKLEAKKTEPKKKAESVKKSEQEKKKEKKNGGEDEQEDEKEDDELHIPVTPIRAPSLTRRHTPSRKVKTYKSLRE